MKETTSDALELTVRLQAALRLGDVDLCADLLRLRGAAMARFETAHRDASAAEITTCGELLRDLKAADADLQRQAAEDLETTAAGFRSSLTSTPAGAQGAYAGRPGQACVDRKA